MHMAAARLGCKVAMVGTEWANSCSGCMNGLRKRYSHLVGNAVYVMDYHSLVNE